MCSVFATAYGGGRWRHVSDVGCNCRAVGKPRLWERASAPARTFGASFPLTAPMTSSCELFACLRRSSKSNCMPCNSKQTAIRAATARCGHPLWTGTRFVSAQKYLGRNNVILRLCVLLVVCPHNLGTCACSNSHSLPSTANTHRRTTVVPSPIPLARPSYPPALHRLAR